ncbi:MAG: hypothetical protein U9N85_05880 [Bacteroidota bacterium]|nr:hypothetical protein [Bacteroidota bacterium]
MHNKFDREIRKDIISKFSEHREPYNPEHWKLMQKKLRKNNQRLLLFSWSIVKAASVVLLAGILTLIPGNTQDYFSETQPNFHKSTPTEKINSTVPEKELKKDIITDKRNFSQLKKNNLTKKNEFLTETIVTDTTGKPMADKSIPTNKDSLMPNKKRLPLPQQAADDRKKRLNFGLHINGALAYTKGNTYSEPGLSTGFTIDYQINDRLAVETGISVSNLQFGFQNSNGDYTTSLSATQLADNIENKAGIIATDIPLNIKFHTRKFVFTGGVSSLVYLHEEYTTDIVIKNSESSNSSDTQTINYSSSYNAFENYNLAGVINLSVGYKYPMSKGILIFEPFTKIPTGGLAGQNISYGYSGIQIHYQF